MASFGPGGKDGKSQDEIQRDHRLWVIEQQLMVMVEQMGRISSNIHRIKVNLGKLIDERQEGR